MSKKYLIVALMLVIFFGAMLFPRNLFSGKEMIFRIEKGEGSRDIAINLERQGLIYWGPIFRLHVLISGSAGKLQAGSYYLTPRMNVYQIAEKLALGDVATAKITIPEGFTARQISGRLQNVTRNDPVTLAEREGYLFPDTYEIPYGMDQEKVIEMMLDNFNKKTAGLAITPEIVTMASLIEKEVRIKEDKEIVSGIFWKRLKNKRALESCATIAYIKGVDQWRYSFEDTRIKSPYNTYLNLGLPLGPICNPGLESIKAALAPKDSPYWYYLSTPEGKTIFSKTLDEHNLAKAKYLK